MTKESTAQTPPYASFTSFDNFIGHLRDRPPLPPRIDKSVMSHLNYGTQQAVLAAFRSLALVDSEDAPTERLEKLIQAKENQRPAIMLACVKEAYPYFWDGTFDLSRATADQFNEKIKKSGKVGGSTVEKAISFFIAAATAAGVKLSPHLTKRKTGNGTAATTSAKRGRTKARKPRAPKPPAGTDTGQDEGSIVNQLLDKFPEFDPKWDKALQEKWFDGFGRLMHSAGVKEAKKP